MNTFIATDFLQKKICTYTKTQYKIYIYIYVVTQTLSSERRVYIAT
jgi:hypothetical protein